MTTNIHQRTAERTGAQAVVTLDQFWPYLVTVLSDRIARRTAQLIKAHGLNLSQWRVLAAIAEVPGRTSAEVVAITPMDKGIVSRATKALLARGSVRREASQTDGRLSHLHLTPSGEQLYNEIMPLVQEVTELASAELSAERQAQLCRELAALIEVIPDLR